MQVSGNQNVYIPPPGGGPGGAGGTGGAGGAGGVGNAPPSGGSGKAPPLGDSLSTSPDLGPPPPNLLPGAPNLPAPGLFTTDHVTHEIHINPWFTSTFLTALTSSILQCVRYQQEGKMAEAQIEIQQMKNTLNIANEIADLIMQKAQTESDMYKQMAEAAMAGVVIGLVGFGLSMVGTVREAQGATSRVNAESTDVPEEETPGTTTRVSTTPGEGGVPGAPLEEPEVETPPEVEDFDPTNIGTTAKPGEAPPEVDNESAAANEQAMNDIQMEQEEGPPSAVGLDESDAQMNAAASGNAVGDSSLDANDPGTIDVEGDTSLTAAGKGASAQVNAEDDIQNQGYNESMYEARGEPKASPTRTQLLKQAISQEAQGKGLSKTGDLFTQSLSRGVQDIWSNLVQSNAKLAMGKDDQLIEIERACKQIADKAMQAASDAFNAQGSIVDSLTQFLTKVQDAVAEAFKQKSA